jgi:pimeloyl-ACP methyl ester carboxylesterase
MEVVRWGVRTSAGGRVRRLVVGATILIGAGCATPRPGRRIDAGPDDQVDQPARTHRHARPHHARGGDRTGRIRPDLGTLTSSAAAGDPARAGDGRLVLLLHGFPETDESYRAFLPALADAGYYAVAPNQRGYSPGARPDGVDAYAIDHLTSDTLALATALGADRFQLVGHD